MGSKGGVPSSLPTPSSPSVVCCMCGDFGLSRDLFRCKVCLSRSQHKYCSDLYPKAETYRACNWCLREEGAKHGVVGVNSINSLSLSDNTTDTNGDNGGGASGFKLHRAVFPSHLGNPVKKPRQLEQSESDVTDRIRSGEISPISGRVRQVLRGKVRRYKLLEEVSS